jgi:hypothetical protein
VEAGGGDGGGDPYEAPPDDTPPQPVGAWSAGLLGPTARAQIATRTVRYTYQCSAVGSMMNYSTGVWENVVVSEWDLSGGTMDSRNTLTIVGENAAGDGASTKTLHLTITYPDFVRLRTRYDPVAFALLRITATNTDQRVAQTFLVDLQTGATYVYG